LEKSDHEHYNNAQSAASTVVQFLDARAANILLADDVRWLWIAIAVKEQFNISSKQIFTCCMPSDMDLFKKYIEVYQVPVCTFDGFIYNTDFDLTHFLNVKPSRIYSRLSSAIRAFSGKLTSATKTTRVLQCPGNNAGQPAQLAAALRASGYDAYSMSMSRTNKYGYTPDYVMPEYGVQSALAAALWSFDNFDVIHYHARPIFWHLVDSAIAPPTILDMHFARLRGKKLVFSFRGGEVRDYDTFSRYCPYAWTREEDYADFLEDEQKRTYVNLISEASDVVTVVDAELATYVPGARILPRSIDCDQWVPSASNYTTTPLVVHAPSRRNVKGSEWVIDAIANCRQIGLHFEFMLIEGMKNYEARAIYEKSDIIIDQLRIGWHGVLGVEAMALGKVLISYIREDLVDFFGSRPPLLLATKETLSDVLREAIQYPSLRREMSLRARKFAESYHDYRAVARAASDIYSSIGSNPPPVANLIKQYVDFSHRVHSLSSMNKKLSRDNSAVSKLYKEKRNEVTMLKTELGKLQAHIKSNMKYDLNTELQASTNYTQGRVISVTGITVEGWIETLSDGPIIVQAHYRHEVIAQAIAETIVEQRLSIRRYAFTIDLPKYCRDGKARRVFIQTTTGENLTGSPILHQFPG
jgi:glycosyltransferase involved in cell wall biosynthesis